MLWLWTALSAFSQSEFKKLNPGFESGSLEPWIATGSAFHGQPIKGDTVKTRRGDMSSQHAGKYWIGTYEVDEDAPTGTLTSPPFKLTSPWVSFLVGGGASEKTQVQIILAEDQSILFNTTGKNTENMHRVSVNLGKYLNKQGQVKLVDDSRGPWGHLNFDDLQLHDKKPEALLPAQVPAPIDLVEHAGLSAAEAANVASLPEGFKMHVFASEPDVRQPIAFCIDDRGRLWVAEGYDYPRRAPDGIGKDRILIFEDTNGDHHFDKRTVFKDKMSLISGLEIGFGGVWVGAAPHLLFIPDRDGDDIPDSDPEVLLDGWDYKRDTHETLNTFCWGPDGWLYGCHGVFCPSHVGKPGTPMADRQRVDAAVWRYHPVNHAFEVFAEGTSNPWGVDFNERGQCVIEACVIPHLWHIIQGARYQRQGGRHYSISIDEMKRNQEFLPDNVPQYLNPFVYDDIKTIGDHVHYTGDKGPHAANNRSDSAGGGHAHAGLMLYLGDSWPEEYRDKAFMNNIHGQRLNMDILTRSGSGYIGSHGPDFLNFNDRWSQVLNMLYDHDGSVYAIDWYDKNQCHHNVVEGHDRGNGRIFKIVYKDQKTTPVNLASLTDSELARLQTHPNEWRVRHARRLLQERAAERDIDREAIQVLYEITSRSENETERLRGLWALHAIHAFPDRVGGRLLRDRSEYVRAWTIQLLCEDRELSEGLLTQLQRMAQSDNSPLVRLYLASALQRLETQARIPILARLIAHESDSTDHNLPLMYWYAAEPVVATDQESGLRLLETCKIPKVREYIVRRIAESTL